MHIKVDEDIPPIAASWLRDQNHQASTVVEQGMGGWKDDQLWVRVQAEQQFLLTADKGFGDIRAFPPGTHGGILLLRPDEDGIRPILDLLQMVLRQVDLSQLLGTIAVATPRGLRIRRPQAPGKSEAS
jgi:predicted nuclease of predicted toxin-antitoxin system